MDVNKNGGEKTQIFFSSFVSHDLFFFCTPKVKRLKGGVSLQSFPDASSDLGSDPVSL